MSYIHRLYYAPAAIEPSDDSNIGGLDDGVEGNVNVAYKSIGGILYKTAVDDTYLFIGNKNFIDAREAADQLLAASTFEEIRTAIGRVDSTILNFIDSPLMDGLYEAIFECGKKNIDGLFTFAINTGNINVLNFLLDRKHELPIYILRDAARAGYSNIVLTLIRHGVKDYGSACAIAVACDHAHIVKLLVDHKVAIIEKGNDWMCIAIQNNNLNIVKSLMSTGVYDLQYFSILKFALNEGSNHIFKYIFDNIKMPLESAQYTELYLEATTVNKDVALYMYQQNRSREASQKAFGLDLVRRIDDRLAQLDIARARINEQNALILHNMTNPRVINDDNEDDILFAALRR